MSRFRNMVCALAGVLALTVSGCGGSGGGGVSGQPVPFEDYCQRYAEITCDAAEECDCLGGFSIELCISYQRSDCADEVEAPVNSGRMSYDPTEGGQCLAATHLIIRDCSLEGDDWPESCDDMLVGQVPEGQGCGDDDECVDPLECYNDQCTAMPGDNEPCLGGSTCGEDRFCGTDDLCHGYRGVNESCTEGGYACDDDLYCDSRDQTCQPYLGSGDSCAHDNYACDDDLYCSPASQTCRPYPTSGGNCADSDGECADGYYCDASNICQPQKGPGSQCSEDRECLSWDCIDNNCEDDTGSCPFF